MYLDVCSLYPYACKYGEFPLGHAEQITENFIPIGKGVRPYFGLVLCKVLPPRGLYHPVLPYKCGGRLTFPLCRTCVETEHQDGCQHSNEERAISGTFVTNELYKAVELDYEVLKIYEVYHWPSKSSPGKFSFGDYINKFLKLKLEKSGWPSWAKNDLEKDNFIHYVKEKEQIDLDKNEVEVNKGLRAIAKICLNSFWGKLGQKTNMSKTEIVSDPEKYFKIVGDKNLIIKSIFPLGDGVMAVSYKSREETAEPLKIGNVALAAFVTATARLKLYEYLEPLGKRVLYYDTVRLIFVIFYLVLLIIYFNHKINDMFIHFITRLRYQKLFFRTV